VSGSNGKPPRSVKRDADSMRNLLATITTPVVLVGHSYGDMAISDAANGMANVKAQAYVVAFGTVQPGHLIQGD
jgi:predicted alpha/beta hydrolase family esterase